MNINAFSLKMGLNLMRNIYCRVSPVLFPRVAPVVMQIKPRSGFLCFAHPKKIFPAQHRMGLNFNYNGCNQ